jgi:dolichol-phosphate mannosyltransferase
LKGLVVVVNYNQEQEIAAFLTALERHQPLADTVVVDDGSSDASPHIAAALGYRVLTHGTNRGVGAAIRTGIHEARRAGYDYVIINSSNGKMRPEDLAAIRGPIERGEADYTTGSRFAAGGGSPGLPRFRRLAIPLFSAALSLLLRRRFSDITCGYRAYTIDWLFGPGVRIDQPWLDRYELEYYIHYWACRSGRRIAEVPVTIRYDHLNPGRTSKISPGRDWWLMARPIVLLSLGLRT